MEMLFTAFGMRWALLWLLWLVRGYAGSECRCWGAADDVGRPVHECECSGAGVTHLPPALDKAPEVLSLHDTGMEMLAWDSFLPFRYTLRDISMKEMKCLKVIESGVFTQLHLLRTIDIAEAPELEQLPREIFKGLPAGFRTLRVVRTGLNHIPDMAGLGREAAMHMIDLESNKIKRIGPNAVQVEAGQLILSYNSIESIDGWAFNGSKIATLKLRGNRGLNHLSEEAFYGLQSLSELDLSETAIPRLPTGGLDGLSVLRIQDTSTLTVIPSVYSFRHLKEAWLTYSFHCCAFKFPARHDPARHQAYLEQLRKYCSYDDTGQIRRRRYSEDMEASWDGFGNEVDGAPSYMPLAPDNGDFSQTTVAVPVTRLHMLCGNLSARAVAQCAPEPDALNPCEDIMGWAWLRVCVWFVVVAAVVGNLAVLLVLLSATHELTVPKFLMCNLAFADLCMGLYLLILAAMDLHSSGTYFNFAFRWQIGYGCQVAGFLTVFASQLSIFTLSIVTLERWFAITYAIFLNKRLKLRVAARIMLGGWLYSVLMAALPLCGVSSYAPTSICLPMETRSPKDVAYLVTLLSVNGLAFLVICVCYAQIYLSLGQDTRHATGRSGEMTVAKKMALLVFTDFACWAPVAFFGLTAVAGYPLIDVTRSKILLVFFYPLNSCANPYLYAILTAQYRRDLFMLLARYGLCTRAAQQYKMNYSLPTTNNSNNHVAMVARGHDPSATVTTTLTATANSSTVEEAFV